MSGSKIKQFLRKGNEFTSTNGSTEEEETEANAASRETTEDKSEAIQLNQAGNNIAEEEDKWKNAIHCHYDFLVDRMFTDFGLLDALWMTRSISHKEVQKIKETRTFYKQNKKLLDLICKDNKYHEFIEALKMSRQTHLMNYLETNGMYITDFYGDWPLTDKEIETLQSNHGMLLDLLDTCDLLGRLYSREVINRRQWDFISSKRNPYEKNEALLDILRRSSLNAYRQTIMCLHASNQSHIAEILENGGVLLRIDSRVQGKAVAVNHAEDEIVAGITNLPGNKKLPESNRIWELVQLNSVSAQQGLSVDLYDVNQAGNGNVAEVTNLLHNKSKPESIHEGFFSNIVNFTSGLDLRRTEDEFEGVWGVTKLRNKIYVLLSHTSVPRFVIFVFEDQIPFSFQKRIEIKDIKYSIDIASIEMENSLYVLDLSRCVWKIEEDEKEKREKIVRWLELKDYGNVSGTLSVTKDDQLLIVGQKKDNSLWTLEIFGGKGKSVETDLCLSIPLPGDIQRPHCALETSKGNFIIPHKIARKKEDESGSDDGRRQMEEEMEEEIGVVSEVSRDGKTIVRRFIPRNEEQKLGSGFCRLAVDSLDRVFLADRSNDRVILLDSNLQWNRILVPTEEDGKEGRRIGVPRRLLYDKERKQLILGGTNEVFVYTFNSE